MNVIHGYIIVFIGAGIGGCLRHAVNRLFGALGSSFPWATFTVNCTGGLIMGLLAGWFAFRVGEGNSLHLPTTGTSGQHLKLFLTTGVLGGYTTFSAFSLDAALLWERGRIWSVVFFVGGSVLISVVALFIGMAMMRP